MLGIFAPQARKFSILEVQKCDFVIKICVLGDLESQKFRACGAATTGIPASIKTQVRTILSKSDTRALIGDCAFERGNK